MDKKIKQNRKAESSAEPQLKEESLVKWVSFWKSKKNLLFLAAILFISFLVYLPSLQNGFVNYDDPIFTYKNSNVVNIEEWGDIVGNLKGIFVTNVIKSYKPLVILSFAFEKLLYGFDQPEWWHLDNILLHLICVLLVFRIALALGLKIIPAAFCALLFGIHPMRVESVAWITERKDVLYGSFYLLALYYYIKSVKLSFKRRYLVIIYLSFILSLLSKIQAVALPLSMLAVDYYFGRKLSLKLIYEKWPFFILSFIRGVAGIYNLSEIGTLEINKTVPLLNKFFYGFYSYIVYIMKSVVPYKMVVFYPFPNAHGWEFYTGLVSAVILGLICFFLRNEKKVVWGLFFYTLNIMFMLQVLMSGSKNFLADRYTYIAYLGLFLIYATGFQWVLGRYKQYSSLIYITAFIILGALGYLNYEQNKIWKNSETLYTNVLEHYPEAFFILNGRGAYYFNEGRIKEALNDFNKAITINPDYHETYYNRGNLYYHSSDQGALKLALNDYTKAVMLSPEKSLYLIDRADTFVKLNMVDNAINDLNRAEKVDPTNKRIYITRAEIYVNHSQFNLAQSDIEKYLSLNPSNSDMWSNLGEASRLNKQYEKSLNALNKAIQINPNKLNYYNARLKTYYEKGDIQRARNDLDYLKSKGFKGIDTEYERLLDQ
jgi:tetratricopeptide (TPR) repeat protein